MRLALPALVLLLAPAAVAQTLLVGNKGENSLSLVDLASGREARKVATGPAPHEIAVSPDGRRAAVVSYGGRTIELFDVASAARTGAVDVGEGARPHGLAWLADGRLVATAEGVDALMIVAPDGRVARIPTGQEGSHMVAVSPDGARAFVANMRSASVTAIDLAAGRKLRDASVGQEPEGIAFDARRNRLWVADRGGAHVHVLDATTLREVARLPTGPTPIRVLLSPDGTRAVVSNFGAGTISEYDAAALRPTRTLRVSGRPAAQQVTLLYAPDGRHLYAAETGADRVAEIDVASGRVLRRLSAGRNGDGLAISPVNAPAR